MSPATLIEVSQMLSKLHDTSYINIRATPEPALSGSEGARNDAHSVTLSGSEGVRNTLLL